MVKKQPQQPVTAPEVVEEYVPLETWAQSNALRYGVELMGGFYHVQEKGKHYFDTEAGWQSLMEAYKTQEVK